MKAAEIGRRFQDFFAAHGHSIVPSASLQYNDPTLLFVNAGMVPFKPYFTGEETPPYHRAVSMQKCVRTLDIEEVGKTTRHGTFFQMLGNFSFGDYFKKDAIAWAWQLVTGSEADGCLGFDPSTVWVTVLGPGHHPDYPDGDVEARQLWLGQGVPSERIQTRGLKDNYWSMGVPGPGGPCSEIYIDRGPQYGADGGPEADEDRFLEIWNLVFQSEELSNVRAKDDFDIVGPLPHKGIDTGAGLERIAFLKQGVDNMYETDEVFPVIARASEITGRRYGDNADDDVRLRIIADHVRSGLMLMADGVRPGNEARGYVLRRLLRRSIRSLRLLGFDGTALVDLMDVSRQVMSTSYPEIDEAWLRIQDMTAAEEASFGRTLAQGTALFNEAARATKASQSSVISGERAFALHDTYGFPIDLTLEMASEQGLEVDRDEFTRLMGEQRDRAKADARQKKGGIADHEIYQEVRANGETPFLGYEELSCDAVVTAILRDGVSVPQATDGIVEVVLDRTPFYAESGGQDSDQGVIRTSDATFDVLDVQRPIPGLIVHTVDAAPGITVGDRVRAEVNPLMRRGSCQAHSATHVLHAALRELVGKDATQAGSYNKPGYLRFDYSSSTPMSAELRAEVEERCNIAIRDDLEVSNSHMKLEEAKAMGALAMFGEKYPAVVRVVEMGGPWSRELCGGTHVSRSSQIGLITILGESSIGSGARRVEALVSTDAFTHLAAERTLVSQLTDMLRVAPTDLPDRVAAMVAELKQAQKTIATLKRDSLASVVASIATDAVNASGVAFASRVLDDVPAGELRGMANDVRDRLGERPGVVALVARSPKPAIVVATNQSARDRGLKAGELLRRGVTMLGGRGGGKDDIAQGGAPDASRANEALREMRESIARA